MKTIAIAASCFLLLAAAPAGPPGGGDASVTAVAGLGAIATGDRAQVVAAANDLVGSVSAGASGPTGWHYGTRIDPRCGKPREVDAFGDGSCNSADTVYAFQTALAATFLSRATIATGDPRYAALAARVLGAWRAKEMKATDCAACIWFPYSDNPNDAGRFVRNTNVLLGMAYAWLSRATGDQAAAATARGVLLAEDRETKRRNMGYFGADDPRYRADPAHEQARIENHIPYVSKGLLDMGRILGDQDAIREAVTLMHAWLDCATARCKPSANVALAPCFLRAEDRDLAQACDRVRQTGAALSAYQAWATRD